MLKSYLITVYLCLSAALLLFAAEATNPSPLKAQDLTELSIEELMDLEITGASKKAQKVKDSAAAVSIISRDEIRRYGYRNLSEALQSLAGIYISSDRNYDYLGLRGFARPGDYGTRILLLIDGHRVNDPNYDNAQVGEDLALDIEDIDRIEVVKGPSSAVWGSNALLGVINLITRSGKGIDGSDFSYEYGSHNRQKAHAAIGGMAGSDTEIAAGLAALSSDGEGHIYFPEFDGPESNYGIADEQDNETAYRTYLKAKSGGLSFMFNHGHRNKDVPTGSYESVFNQHGNFTEDEATRFDLSYTTAGGPASDGNIFTRIYFDKVKYYGEYLYESDREDPDLNHDASDSAALGAELRYSFSLTDNLSLMSGLEVQDVYQTRFFNTTDQPDNVINTDVSDNWTLTSFYSEVEYQARQDLKLVAGLRLDDYTFLDANLSPRAGLLYQAPWDIGLKLLYGEAFRAANYYERAYSDEITGVGNDSLTPEDLRSYEMILERSFASVQASLSLFHYEMSDIITQVTNQDEMLQFQNTGDIESNGLELQARLKLKSGIIGHASFSFVEAEDGESGARISNSPRQTATLGASLPLWGEKLYVSPQLLLVSDRLTLQGNHSGSWKMANLVLYSEALPADLKLSLGLYDILDDTRYAPGSEEHLQDRIPQDGRTWRLQVSRSLDFTSP